MAEHFYDPTNENMGKDFTGNMSMTYTFGTHAARVKVDRETGKVRILNYVAAHDVGKAINPLLLEGQVYGGVMMGVGYALSEQVSEIRHKVLQHPDGIASLDPLPLRVRASDGWLFGSGNLEFDPEVMTFW